MFADSFGVLFIHCVARELGSSFLYKCLASRGGPMRQHGLLVGFACRNSLKHKRQAFEKYEQNYEQIFVVLVKKCIVFCAFDQMDIGCIASLTRQCTNE